MIWLVPRLLCRFVGAVVVWAVYFAMVLLVPERVLGQRATATRVNTRVWTWKVWCWADIHPTRYTLTSPHRRPNLHGGTFIGTVCDVCGGKWFDTGEY